MQLERRGLSSPVPKTLLPEARGPSGVVRPAAALAVAALLGGCHPLPPRPPGVEPLPPGSDPPEAVFEEALVTYRAAAEGGWTGEECAAVAAAFEATSRTVEGGSAPALFDAGVAMLNCDAAAAAALFRRADEAARAGPDQREGHAPSLLALGAIAYRRGDRDGALRLFDGARVADRRSADAYTGRGMVLREAGDYAEAQLELRRALAVDSDHLGAYAQLALLYLALGRERPQLLDIADLLCAQAVARAEATSASGPAVAPIYNAWGLVRMERGDIVGAVERFDAARRGDPDLFEAHMNSGAVTLSFRGFEAAEEAFRDALRVRPGSYEATLSLGAALRGEGRFAEARAAYEAALALEPARPEAHYDLGVLLQDYLVGEEREVAGQLARLEEAQREYASFLEACGAAPRRCTRQGPDGAAEDVREAAARRVRACEETAEALGSMATAAP